MLTLPPPPPAFVLAADPQEHWALIVYDQSAPTFVGMFNSSGACEARRQSSIERWRQIMTELYRKVPELDSPTRENVVPALFAERLYKDWRDQSFCERR